MGAYLETSGTEKIGAAFWNAGFVTLIGESGGEASTPTDQTIPSKLVHKSCLGANASYKVNECDRRSDTIDC